MDRQLRTYQVLLRTRKREAIYECEAFDEKDAKAKAQTYANGTDWKVKSAAEPEI